MFHHNSISGSGRYLSERCFCYSCGVLSQESVQPMSDFKVSGSIYLTEAGFAYLFLRTGETHNMVI